MKLKFKLCAENIVTHVNELYGLKSRILLHQILPVK